MSDVLKVFEKAGALMKGHFLLSSGLHSGQYLQCALVLQHPEYAEDLCVQLADKFKNDNPTVVLAPAIGGIIVSYGVAKSLGVRSVFAERVNGKMTLRRNFDINSNDKVLIVEDVITTGGSTKELIGIVKAKGAKLAGVGAIVDRSKSVNFGTKFESLLKIDIPTYKKENCPLCKDGEPAVKPGSRK